MRMISKLKNSKLYLQNCFSIWTPVCAQIIKNQGLVRHDVKLYILCLQNFNASVDVTKTHSKRVLVAFSKGFAAGKIALPIVWKQLQPVWIKQWPLTKEKLCMNC